MLHPCPKGHQSTEADFCSECGTKLSASVTVMSNATPPPPPVTIGNLKTCPDCATPHDPLDGKFCEICGYNFETQKSAPVEIPPIEIPPLDPTLIPPPLPSVSTPVSEISIPNSQFSILIEIDPSLAAPESPPAPAQAPITLPLTAQANLIGRHNTARAINPEIALDFDDAISSRHALLTVQPDGILILRDIGSSNGTMLNGQEITALQDYPVQAGDRITLGHWTSLTIQTA